MDLPRVITVRGKPRTIFYEWEFCDLLRDEIGPEALDLYVEKIDELCEEIRTLQKELAECVPC